MEENDDLPDPADGEISDEEVDILGANSSELDLICSQIGSGEDSADETSGVIAELSV